MHLDAIRKMAGWVAEAGLACLELKQKGFELRLVGPPRNPAAVAVPAALPTPPPAPLTVLAMATVCGHFHARHPARDTAQASPGQAIAVGDTVGVVAVGTLLLPVLAHTAGRAGAYLVEDGQLVDYATPLLAGA